MPLNDPHVHVIERSRLQSIASDAARLADLSDEDQSRLNSAIWNKNRFVWGIWDSDEYDCGCPGIEAGLFSHPDGSSEPHDITDDQENFTKIFDFGMACRTGIDYGVIEVA